LFVGLDYHQAFIQACVLDAAGNQVVNRRCDNSAASVLEAVSRFQGTPAFAVESCCGAADFAEELVAAAGVQVSMAHAGYVHKLKQSPDKTDWSDARLLADLLRVGYLPHVWLPPSDLRQLKYLVRYRSQLAKARRAAKLRVTALLRAERIELLPTRWTKKWTAEVRKCVLLGEEGLWVVNQQLDEIEALQKRIDQVDKRLEDETVLDPFVQELRKMAGIGLVTAVTLRAELGTMDRFRSGKQLSKFCGLSPRNASSGKKQADAGLIQTANRELRSLLIEAAHRLMRLDPKWRKLGVSLRSRGKSGSLVAAAVANRWVRWLYHQLKPIPFQPA
jgi:transposase